MNTFERALYADPDGDLDALWWELVRATRASRLRTTAARPTGRRRSTSPSRRSTTTRISTARSSRFSSLAALESELGGIVDRPEAGTLLRREALRARRVDSLGPPRRAGFGRAALRRVPRARGGARRRMTDVAPLRPGADLRGRGAQDQLPRALLRSRLRVRVHAGDSADPRGHDSAGVRPRGARARDGVVGVVGLRVDDERDRRRERGHAPDHVRGDGGRVLHGARRPRRVPGRGRMVRRRLLRRARAQLDAVRVGCPRRPGGPAIAMARLSPWFLVGRGASRSSADSSRPTTAPGCGSPRSSSTSSGR